MDLKNSKEVALELFKQKQKIRQAENRLHREKEKLKEIAKTFDICYLEEKITDKQDIIQVTCRVCRWGDVNLTIEKIGSIKDFQSLINSAK